MCRQARDSSTCRFGWRAFEAKNSLQPTTVRQVSVFSRQSSVWAGSLKWKRICRLRPAKTRKLKSRWKRSDWDMSMSAWLKLQPIVISTLKAIMSRPIKSIQLTPKHQSGNIIQTRVWELIVQFIFSPFCIVQSETFVKGPRWIRPSPVLWRYRPFLRLPARRGNQGIPGDYSVGRNLTRTIRVFRTPSLASRRRDLWAETAARLDTATVRPAPKLRHLSIEG